MNSILEDKEPSDEEILETAFNNAYDIFTGARDFTEMSLSPDIQESYLPFDPYYIMDKEKFESVKLSMLDWFAEEDEFEKCIFIRDYEYAVYVLTMKPFSMD
tara:strand:- start:213 stop:518 length:306 start_codon:yes stop_codon:yes gene_type:complete